MSVPDFLEVKLQDLVATEPEWRGRRKVSKAMTEARTAAGEPLRSRGTPRLASSILDGCHTAASNCLHFRQDSPTGICSLGQGDAL